MISRQFFKSSVIYSSVGALPYASGFLLIPWFMELLSPVQFGVNALYISLMYFIQILATWGFDMSAGMLYYDYRHDRAKLRKLLGTVLFLLIAFGAAAFLLFFAGGIRLFDLVFGKGSTFDLIPFGIMTILSGIFNGIFKVYSNLLINQMRPERFFWINLLNFAVVIGASLSLLYLFPFTLYGPIAGRLAAALLSGTLAVILLSAEYGLTWQKEYARKILSYSTPLLVFTLLGWVFSYIDRFIVLRLMGDATFVGIYDFAVKLILAIELIQLGLINSINPRIFNFWKDSGLAESSPEVNRYYHSFTALNLLIIPVFILVAPLVLPLVIRKELYYEAFGFLALLGAGYATRTWYYMYLAPLLFFKRTRALPKVLLYTALLQVILSSVLIWFFGLMGAVWANLLAKPAQAFFLWTESRKVFRFSVNPWKIFWLPILYILATIAASQLFRGTWMIVGQGVTLLLSAGMVALVYRRELPLLLRRFWRS
jgi:O-antigen/teichoic acid export membrane protein